MDLFSDRSWPVARSAAYTRLDGIIIWPTRVAMLIRRASKHYNDDNCRYRFRLFIGVGYRKVRNKRRPEL